MKLFNYQTYDVCAKQFKFPILTMRNDSEMIRYFQYQVECAVDGQPSMIPLYELKDTELYKISTIDSETGEVEECQKELISRATDYVDIKTIYRVKKVEKVEDANG